MTVSNRAYGAVYQARHKGSGFLLAIKEIQVVEGKFSEELKNEIEILKKCRHKSVVSYFGSCPQKNKIWVSALLFLIDNSDLDGLLPPWIYARFVGNNKQNIQRIRNCVCHHTYIGRTCLSPRQQNYS